MFKKRQKVIEEVEYIDEYFYTLNSWWIRTKDGNFEGTRKVNMNQVPLEYIEHFDQQPQVIEIKYID